MKRVPIPTPVSLTVTPPVRLAVLIGALVLTGLAAVVFFVGRGAVGDDVSATSTTPTPTAPRTSSPPETSKPRVAKPKPTRAASGFPPRIDHALRYNRVVVVSVAMPGAPVDAIVRREARAAAKAGRAAFVPVSALNERAVSGLVAKAGVLPDPAVVIVKRPGVVVSTFSVTDAATIQQAVAQARR
jgi:hypothetical protein